MAHLVFQALLLRSMKQIGGRNWKRKGRWWFWLQDSYLYQSSEDCKGCNGTSLPQSHLEVCSFWNCFVSFVFLNSVWIRNKHGKCRLTNAAFSHVDCLVRSEALCLCERWSCEEFSEFSASFKSWQTRTSLRPSSYVRGVREFSFPEMSPLRCGVHSGDVRKDGASIGLAAHAEMCDQRPHNNNTFVKMPLSAFTLPSTIRCSSCVRR